MSAIEIDPFAASESILSRVPAEFRARLGANLNLPATRRELVDFVTAQATLNVTMASALVSLSRHDDQEVLKALGSLLEQVQQLSNHVGSLTAHALIGNDTAEEASD